MTVGMRSEMNLSQGHFATPKYILIVAYTSDFTGVI